MKRFNPKNYSLITKTLILFLFISIFIIILISFLAQPKITKKNYKNDIAHISTTLLLIKNLINIHSSKEQISQSLLEILELKSSKIEFFESELINDDLSMSENKINDITFIIWSVKLDKFDSDKKLFLRLSVDKNELKNINNIDFLVFLLLQESIIVVLISLILFLFIFRKMLNNIELLNTQISKSLEEKEVLLKEIHHRVKNNLALTISLIELQEEEIEDEKTRNVLKNIQERIYTMELIHRKLYESTNLNKIPFKNYIFDLIENITKTYIQDKQINSTLKIEDINLNIETALPYGLILNELITNSFKYAFKHNNNPKLEIMISQQNLHQIILIVKDNGKGLRNNFSEISNDTLGFRLINMIVKYQLMGTIEYKYDNGAQFKIIAKI